MQLARMNTLRPLGLAPKPRQPCQARKLMGVQCSTMWYLQPDAKWCSKPENQKFCKALAQVDLTGPIGTKRVCSIASHDFQSEEAQDLTIVEHGGIHLVFDAEGSSNPLDSPSLLYVTDLDSSCDIFVNGHQLEKRKRTQLKPGSVISMGQEAQYQVQRNVFAHA